MHLEAGEHGWKAAGWDGLASKGAVRATSWCLRHPITLSPLCSAFMGAEKGKAAYVAGPAGLRTRLVSGNA